MGFNNWIKPCGFRLGTVVVRRIVGSLGLQVGGVWWGFTFILSMQASIFSCSTAFLAWEMLAVLLLAMPSFMALLWGGNVDNKHHIKHTKWPLDSPHPQQQTFCRASTVLFIII